MSEEKSERVDGAKVAKKEEYVVKVAEYQRQGNRERWTSTERCFSTLEVARHDALSCAVRAEIKKGGPNYDSDCDINVIASVEIYRRITEETFLEEVHKEKAPF